ncbi:hypothetical protein YC2023_010069 [Brassica napus]
MIHLHNTITYLLLVVPFASNMYHLDFLTLLICALVDCFLFISARRKISYGFPFLFFIVLVISIFPNVP